MKLTRVCPIGIYRYHGSNTDWHSRSDGHCLVALRYVFVSSQVYLYQGVANSFDFYLVYPLFCYKIYGLYECYYSISLNSYNYTWKPFVLHSFATSSSLQHYYPSITLKAADISNGIELWSALAKLTLPMVLHCQYGCTALEILVWQVYFCC